jgi:hypothetical protein
MAITLQAIGELIALGEQEGFGITFNPDETGWTVGYLRGMGGGDLLTGFELGDTARAAMRPLLTGRRSLTGAVCFDGPARVR